MINNKTLNQIIMESVKKYSEVKEKNDLMTNDEQLMFESPEEYKKRHQVLIEESQNVLEKIKKEMKMKEIQMKLEVLLLHYIFFEDDGKISSKEKKAIKTHFSTYKNKVSSSIIKELKTIKNIDSLSHITRHIQTNNIKHNNIKKALTVIKGIVSNDEAYTNIIKKIESSIYFQ